MIKIFFVYTEHIINNFYESLCMKLHYFLCLFMVFPLQAGELVTQSLLHRAIETSDVYLVTKTLACATRDGALVREELEYARAVHKKHHTVGQKLLRLIKKPGFSVVLGSAFYTSAWWFAGETLLDLGYGYNKLKNTYGGTIRTFERYQDLKYIDLTPSEIKFFSFTQALSQFPRVFNREICAVAITSGLFYLGSQAIKNARHELTGVHDVVHDSLEVVDILETYLAKLENSSL